MFFENCKTILLDKGSHTFNINLVNKDEVSSDFRNVQ